MIMRFEHFNDSVNIAVILTPGCKFFTAKCTQFFLTFIE